MRLSHLSRKWATINDKDTFMCDKGRILSCSIREGYFLSRHGEHTFLFDRGSESEGIKEKKRRAIWRKIMENLCLRQDRLCGFFRLSVS